MTTRSLLAAATATAILALSCAPQQPQSLSPSAKDQVIEVGQSRSGTLTAKDDAGDADHVQSWALVGHRGQAVVVDLIATQFDPRLMVVGPGLQPRSDDDGGGACNARLSFTVPEDGLYWMLVGGSGTGTFTLRAATAAGPQAAGSCGGTPDEKFSAEDLASVPVVGPLSTGEDLRGELTDQDRMLKDQHAKAYEVRVARGSTLTIDLTSTAFDAYLAVTGPGLEKPLEDDDSGGGCDARVQLNATQDGTYRVVVTSASDGETGRFVLRARRDAAAPPDKSCDMTEQHSSNNVSPDELSALPVQGTIRLGDDVAGELKTETPTIVDGTHALVWTIAGSKGRTVIVDLIATEFDAFLMVVGPGLDNVLTDDDSGGACNPRVALTFPADGLYRLVANTVDRGATGKFHLKVSGEKTPTVAGECNAGRAR